MLNRLLPAHKIILLSSAIALALALVLHINGTGPNAAKHKRLSQQVKDLEEQLQGMQLPQDAEAIASVRLRAAARHEALQEDLDKAMGRYRSLYEPLIQKNNWTLDSFIRKAPLPPRNFYVNEFDRIVVQSPYGNLDVPGSPLGLEREVYGDNAHWQMLQLWCLDVLLTQAKTLDLELVFSERKAQTNANRSRRKQAAPQKGATRVAELMVLPAVETGWTGQGEKRRATLVRLGFRLALRGRLAQLESFVRLLGKPGTFFGVSAFELVQLPPAKNAKAEDLKAGCQELRLECLTYLPLPPPEE